MRRIYLLAVLFVACLSYAAPPTQLEKIKQKGEIVIGMKENSPPFSQLDPKTSTLKGYDVDFAKGIARRLNASIAYKIINEETRMPMLKSGQIDLLIADLTKTPQRSKEINFSVGYFVTGSHVLARKGRFKDEKDLNGTTQGITRGSSTAERLRKTLPGIKLSEGEDTNSLVNTLLVGRLDGVIADEPTLRTILSRMKPAQRAQYEVSEFALDLKVLAVGMRKGESDLQDAINKALADMEKSGEAAAIFDRWFGPETPSGMHRIFTISSRRVE